MTNHSEQSTPANKKRKTNNANSSNQTTNSSSTTHYHPNPTTQYQTMKTIDHEAAQLFFTTQRFKTPAKDTNQPSPSPSSPTPSSSSSSSSTSHRASKLKNKLPVTPHHSSPPSNHTHLLSDHESPPHHNRTPKATVNPHIYGRQDRQLDAETSLITAETPMQHKNREFRRGRSKPIDPLAQNVTKLSAQSLQAFDSTPSRGRRGSRGSSIGSGHEALPHPRIPPSSLCRHIRTDLPPTMRCRTLVSWSAQKAEDLTNKTLSPQHFKPTRLIMDELPKTLLKSFNHQSKLIPPLLSSSSSQSSHHHSKLILKIVQSTIKNFIRGICENQVEINWAPTDIDQNGIGLTSEDEDHQRPDVDFDSLPVHPQDVKNERKIKELEDWRTRMSYEDYARQYQLNRYGNLMEKLNREEEPLSMLSKRAKRTNMSTDDGEEKEELGPIDTKKLVDLESILEFGRLLRRRETAKSPIPRSIDVICEHGRDWCDLSSNVGTIAENLTRIDGRVTNISKKSKELLTSSTYKLRQVSSEEGGGRMSSIEAKMLLSSMDGIQLCLKSLNLISPYDDLPFPSKSDSFSSPSSAVSAQKVGHSSSRGPWLSPNQIGKRDLLRALSRSSRT